MPDTVSGRSIVALAGATGFIGRHLQRALLDSGYFVRALVRPAAASSQSLVDGVDIEIVDLRSEDSLTAAVQGVDAVVYAAGSVRGRTAEDFHHANVEGVQNLTSALRRSHPQTPLLLLSSLAASAPELSPYASSKAAGERALHDSGLHQWCIFRPPAVYGPGDAELRLTFNLIRHGVIPLIAPSEQKLQFIEVSDLARATVAWVGDPSACTGATFAIDDGTPGGYDWHTIQRELAPERSLRIRVPRALLAALGYVNLLLSQIVGYAPMITPGKVRELTYLDWACSNEEFTAATGWQPELSLAEGVGRIFARTTI